MSGDSDVDVVIAGGGLIGASLACALGSASLRVAVIEPTPFDSARQTSHDARAVAVSYGSRRVLDTLGLWSQLGREATPIRSIHVSDRGHFGMTRMNAADHGLEALGYVLDARTLGSAMVAAMSRYESVMVYSPAQIADVNIDTGAARVEVRSDSGDLQLNASLLVAADGGDSAVRQQLGITADAQDYRQCALIANVVPRAPHNNTAYERFTDNGPLALLPMQGRRCGLVWTLGEATIDEVLALPDVAFLSRLGHYFGARLGRFSEVGARSHYPLSLVRSREQVRERVVLVGNAAHTLHPVAGQGFNLGLRDIAVLAQVVVDAVRAGEDPGAETQLRRYLAWRRPDQGKVTAFTDALVRIFSNRFAPLSLGRNLGLLAADLATPLNRGLARHAMGIAGRQPRLGRGLPL